MDKVAEIFQATWKDLMDNGRKALEEGDGALLLRTEGGRAVLMHIAHCLGYETKVAEAKGDDGQQGQGKQHPKSERREKKKKGAGKQ